MSQEESGPSSRTLSFEESVKFLRGVITKMLDIDRKIGQAEERTLSNAIKTGDQRLEHVSLVALKSYQNADALFMIASYLLDILETQALVNQQLLAHINLIATKPIPSATIGEIVKSGLDQLVKEAEEKARKLPRSLYT